MRFAAHTALILLPFTLTLNMAAGQSAPAADLQQEAAAAQALYDQQNFVGALPLYEDLHNRVPASLIYRERLAMALIGSAATRPAAEQPAIRDRARKLLLEAQAAGDNSNLLQIMLEKLGANPGVPSAPTSPGAEDFANAEKAFSNGNLPAALKLYEKAFAEDPTLYEAPLYAGDSEFKLGHYAEANAWYAKAVTVNPERETAYRYWGDSLMKMGDNAAARDKFIESILAQPYQRTPRIGLQQWANANHMRFLPPPITLPSRAQAGGTDKNGNPQININLDPSAMSGPAGSAVLAYSMGSAIWHGDKFRQAYPNEKQYRHSLAEEVDSIHTALSVLKEKKVSPDTLDATWKTLLQLDSEGLLECWILLDHPDQGIAQDYLQYRAAHRDLLRQYIAKYDLHPA